MNLISEKIIGITVGIRFTRSFRIPDISGDLIDHVLNSNTTPFGTSYFPKVEERSNREKTLYNPDSYEYLRVNTDDIILGTGVDGDFDKKFAWLKNDVLSYFKSELFRVYKIKNILRLGIIFSHKLEKTEKLSDVVDLFTANEVTNADNVVISFSKKDAATEALFRKGVNDYKNKIYNFQELTGGIRADLDFQYYYKPAVEDLRECFTDEVLDDARKFLEGSFYKWIDKIDKYEG